MSAPLTFAVTSVASSTGIYQGTFPGGASSAYAGMWVTISGFANPLNNGTFQITASTASQITTTNSSSVSQTNTASAIDVTPYTCLDSGGLPSAVVTAATGTTGQWSVRFSVLDRPGGGPRNLWLQMGQTTGTVSAATFNLLQSMDGGLTWKTLQAGIDLVNSGAQQVSPPPSPGAVLQVVPATLTGSGATVTVLASSN